MDTTPALAAAATAVARVPVHRLLLRPEVATLAAAGILEEGMLAEGMPREGTPAVHMVVAAAALRHSHFQARLHRRFEAPLLHRPALRLRCLSSNRRRLCSNRRRLCSNHRQPSSNRRKRRRASRCSDRGYYIGYQSLSPYSMYSNAGVYSNRKLIGMNNLCHDKSSTFRHWPRCFHSTRTHAHETDTHGARVSVCDLPSPSLQITFYTCITSFHYGGSRASFSLSQYW